MFFKNLHIYRFTRQFQHTAESLQKMLESHVFTPCSAIELTKFGWISPVSNQSEILAHEAQGQLLLCAKKEEKVIPTAVIKDMLQDKIDEMEAEQGRALKKKEKEALKDELLHTLIPRAFPRNSQAFIWINIAENYLVVDAPSAKKADDVLSLLRKCTGSLPVIPLALTNPPEITMTEWLNTGAALAGFVLGNEAELRSALEHGGIVRTKDQDLVTDEIKAHLQADKLVTKLALTWSDAISFVISDDMQIKRVKFSNEIREQNDDVLSEDHAARMDADFALMTGELAKFIPDLISALGGEKDIA